MSKENTMDSVKNYWDSKEPKVKKAIIASILLLVVCVGVFIYLYTKDTYEFLLSTNDKTVSANVINKLKEDSIKYTVKGESIYVSGVNPDALKLELSGSGALESHDSNMDLFSSPLFISEKQENKLIQKDLESSISNAIKSYNEVADAKVLLTMGKESSFKNDIVPAKAAIQIKLKSKLSAKQVSSIQMFVANSVPNLDKSDVVITDTDNNLLSKNTGEEASIEDNDAYVKSMEDKLSTQIEELLKVAFPNSTFKVVPRVEINFDKTKVEKETVQSGPDTIVSQETSSEITTNTSSGGQAGAESNVPSYETPTNNNETLSEKKHELINYELNKVKEQITKSPEIKKLSVAVISNQSIGPTDKDKIQELVETAALIDEERGDKVSVQGFDAEVDDSDENKESFISKHMDTIIDKSVLIALLIVILIIGLKVISLFRKNKEEEENMVDVSISNKDYEQFNGESMELSEELVKRHSELNRKKQVIEKEMDENPQKVASVLKAWQEKDKKK